ncbi:MAG: DUF2075 domain-containing protein [Clostridiales bacterium]|nr:DUF2075 domain-containing protein [Clostridiales bacterium]
MILYEGDIRAFKNAVNRNKLASYMASVFERKYSRKITIELQREWNYSLKCLYGIVVNAEVSEDCCIRLDFVLSQYCSRLEALLAGRDLENRQHIVMVELLPWRESMVSDQEDMIRVHDDLGWHDSVHPAYQSAAYGRYISERSGAGDLSSVTFVQTVYMYDYIMNHPEPLLDSQYNNLLTDVHLFFSDEAEKLSALLNKYIAQGGGREILNRLRLRDQFCPEGLEEYLNRLDEDAPFISLYEDQKMASASILRDLDKEGQKSVTLISGMPGTGKTAIAVTLIHNLARKGKRIAYISYTAALMHYIKNIFQTREENIDFMTFHKMLGASRKNEEYLKENVSFLTSYDMIICDESQDMEGFPGWRKALDRLLSMARVSVFLYSSNQRVLGCEFNLPQYLEKQASGMNMTYHTFDLNRNIRFKDKSGGLYWLLHQLQLDTNSNYDDWDPDSYEIKVVDHPGILADYIKEKNSQGFLARMVANFNKGSLKEKDGVKSYVLEEYGFSRPVVSPGNRTFEDWLAPKNDDEMIGTVHMCKGLEFDYAGILIDDLSYDQETGNISASKGFNTEGEYDVRLLGNIYHVLFTRARKGIYIFCRDQALNCYLKDRISYARRKHYWIDYFMNLYSAEAEDRRVKELCDAKWKAVSEEEHLRLRAQLEKARKEAEYYRNRYMAAEKILDILGISPEDMENIQNKLKEIKDSSEQIKDEEERAHYIQSKTSDLLLNRFMPMIEKQAHVDGIEKRLEQVVGAGAWSKISTRSKRFLITAEVVYESIEAYNQLIDFSGVCLQVTKAFECEMTYRYFTHYREYLKNRFGNNYAYNMPQAFYKLRRGKKVELDEDEYTLGSIVYTTGMWKEGNTIRGYERDQALFMDYAQVELLIHPNNAHAVIKRHLREIEKIRVRYRNSAAHKDPIDVIGARECLDYIVEIQRILGSLLDDYRL